MKVRRGHGLKTRYQRLRERGLLTNAEMAERLGVSPATIKIWRRQGVLVGTQWSNGNHYLYEMPDNPPVRNRHKFKQAAMADGAVGTDGRN